MSDEDVRDDDYYGNALEIGGEIHKQSKVIQKFTHLPHDTKYSFFDKVDKVNYHYKSGAYQSYNYIKKMLKLSKIEIDQFLDKRKEIYKCKSEEDFSKYFKSLNKNYLWNQIKDLPKSERDEVVKTIKTQLNKSKNDGFVHDIYNVPETFYTSLSKYVKANGLQDIEIDDIGLLHNMMTTTEVAKAFKGNAVKSMNTTINVNRETRPEEEAEEDPEESEKSGGFTKKFFKKRQ